MQRRIMLAVTAGVLSALSGCGNKPGGPGYSDDIFTYYSLPHEPVTLTVMDTRTGQALWTHEVPVGKEITVKFEEETSPENTMMPATMKWGEAERGNGHASLENSVPVPDKYSRRIDLTHRAHPEMPPTAGAAPEGAK